MRDPSAPDPLLTGTPLNPCLDGANYAPGVSANGDAVPPADLPTVAPPLAGTIVIAHHHRARNRPDIEVPVDLAQLSPPECDAPAPPQTAPHH